MKHHQSYSSHFSQLRSELNAASELNGKFKFFARILVRKYGFNDIILDLKK